MIRQDTAPTSATPNPDATLNLDRTEEYPDHYFLLDPRIVPEILENRSVSITLELEDLPFAKLRQSQLEEALTQIIDPHVGPVTEISEDLAHLMTKRGMVKATVTFSVRGRQLAFICWSDRSTNERGLQSLIDDQLDMVRSLRINLSAEMALTQRLVGMRKFLKSQERK